MPQANLKQPGTATNEMSGFDFGGASELGALTQPPVHASIDAERAYLKERLCAAIRIFAQHDLDHGGAFPLRHSLCCIPVADSYLSMCTVVRRPTHTCLEQPRGRTYIDQLSCRRATSQYDKRRTTVAKGC